MTAMEYESFFREPLEIFKAMLSVIDRGFVHENIEMGNGIRVTNGSKRDYKSKLVAFPLDSNNPQEAEYFARFCTSSDFKNCRGKPKLIKGKLDKRKLAGKEYNYINGIVYHPSLISQEKRNELKNNMIKHLSDLDKGLTDYLVSTGKNIEIFFNHDY
jgi:hypothetical protein